MHKPAQSQPARHRTDPLAAWKVLLVDDDPEVHDVTRMVLSGFQFEGRTLDIISAMSESEARQRLQDLNDVALILLDVVMEDDRSGLNLVEYIREELHNRDVRIVLRTGQPGQAPEREVVDRYDINDYKEKTELTAQKLSTGVYAALRAWRDIQALRASERGLERVISASSLVFSHEHRTDIQAIVLEQLSSLLEGQSVGCAVAQADSDASLDVICATGSFASAIGRDARRALLPDVVDQINAAAVSGQHQLGTQTFVLAFEGIGEGETWMFFGELVAGSELAKNLLRLFAANITSMLQSVRLAQNLSEAQMEMVFMLAGATESRSHETAAHVHRVGLLAELLAREHGLDSPMCDRIRLAAPLHDVGKIGIPDAILNKPGPHTPEETQVMRTHTDIGYRMLAASKHPVLQLGAEIAISHHERWEGGGYPAGLSGEAIPVSGRITMLADVFDALGSRRCYKDAWSDERILQFILDNKGKMFDPALVDILLRNLDQAVAIRRAHPD